MGQSFSMCCRQGAALLDAMDARPEVTVCLAAGLRAAPQQQRGLKREAVAAAEPAGRKRPAAKRGHRSFVVGEDDEDEEDGFGQHTRRGHAELEDDGIDASNIVSGGRSRRRVSYEEPSENDFG